jgi:hypothetical protein
MSRYLRFAASPNGGVHCARYRAVRQASVTALEIAGRSYVRTEASAAFLVRQVISNCVRATHASRSSGPLTDSQFLDAAGASAAGVVLAETKKAGAEVRGGAKVYDVKPRRSFHCSTRIEWPRGRTGFAS